MRGAVRGSMHSTMRLLAVPLLRGRVGLLALQPRRALAVRVIAQQHQQRTAARGTTCESVLLAHGAPRHADHERHQHLRKARLWVIPEP